MAKDVFRSTSAVELVGMLDTTVDDRYVVYVETKEATFEVDLLDLLSKNTGRKIALKLTTEDIMD